MLVKLNYTADTDWKVGFRILNHIMMTDTAINSTSTLQASLVGFSAHASMTNSLDYINSAVVKVTTITNTITHYSQPTNGQESGEFTVRMTSYDTTSTYFYYQLYDTSGTSINAYTNLVQRVGPSLSSGAMTTSTNATMTAATQSTVAGTAAVINSGATGYVLYGSKPLPAAAAGMTNIRCFWFYITDNIFMWAVTSNSSSSPLGFGTTYGSSNGWSGPWIFGQYTRYDYHNTAGNGVLPFLMSNDKSSDGYGFGQTTDWSQAHSLSYNAHAASYNPPFSVYNLVSALPQVGTSWPLIYNQQVHWGVGPRYDDVIGLNQSATNSAASRTTQCAYPTLFTTVSTRFPTADLSSTAYAMLPILWRASYYGNTGGNMSARTGVYLFNGDYFPGDQFTLNGITYIIWPVWSGYSNRIGLAVPRL